MDTRSRLLALVVLAGVAVCGCTAPSAAGAPGGLVGPSPVASIGQSDCPTAILLEKIEPLAGLGFSTTWVRARYIRGTDLTPPAWTVDADQYERVIRPYRVDLFVAYVVGKSGRVVVRAAGPCGVVGELLVVHSGDPL